MSAFSFRPLLMLLGLALLLIGLGWLFSDILLYFVVSLIIAALLRPLVDYLNEVYLFGRRLPRGLAVLAAFVVLVAGLGVFVLLFLPLVSEQFGLAKNSSYEVLFAKLTLPITLFEKFLISNFGLDQKRGFLTEALRQNFYDYFNSIETSTVLNSALHYSSALFIFMLAVLFISFFLLYEKGLLRRNIIALIPNAYFELTITTIHKVERLLSGYLLGLFLEIFSIFTLTAIGLTILDIKYAFTIAVFAGLVNIVPYIGPIVGSTFAVLVAISTTTFDGNVNNYMAMIVKIIILEVVIHLIDNVLLQPLIFSRSVKAHPLEIFIAIFAGAALAGPVGMIAAIPVYTVLRVTVGELRGGYKKYHIFRK